MKSPHTSGPSVSIIIPAYNAARTIEPCVRSVLAQDYPRLELMVVDDGSSDPTAELARTAGARVCCVPVNRGTAAARNTGAAATQGEILIFMDADIVLPAGSVQRMVARLLSQPDAMGVGATYSENSAWMDFISDYKNLDLVFRDMLNPEHIRFLATFFFALRRSDFVRVGGFDERFPGSSVEDMEFCLRLCGFQPGIFMDKQIKADHLKTYDLRGMLTTNHRRLFNMVRILRMYPGNLRAGPAKAPIYFFNLAAPWLLLAAAGASACTLNPLPAVTVAGACLLANHKFFRFLYQRRGAMFALRSAPLFFAEYLCAGLSVLFSSAYFLAVPPMPEPAR